LKRERRPPKNWRRNMVAAAAFLVLLDAAIVSGAPSPTRVAFALVVTLLVGAVIIRIWLSNTKIEKAGSSLEQGAPVGNKPSGSGRRAKRRRAV